MKALKRNRRGDRGQALVEFALVLIPFMWLLMGVVDLGRGIYVYNGVAQAAREIARADSVHACDAGYPCTLGTASQTTSAINVQKGLVPGLASASASITFACTDASDTVLANSSCGTNLDSTGDDNSYVRVTVTVPFTVVTPFLGPFAPSSMTSVAHVKLP
jgi:Flp pilus assembly protein TadG